MLSPSRPRAVLPMPIPTLRFSSYELGPLFTTRRDGQIDVRETASKCPYRRADSI